MAEILDSYMTEAALAVQLGKCERTLKRWRRLRTGPTHTMIGKRIVYAVIGLGPAESVRCIGPDAMKYGMACIAFAHLGFYGVALELPSCLNPVITIAKPVVGAVVVDHHGLEDGTGHHVVGVFAHDIGFHLDAHLRAAVLDVG
jgi:hypothetical protein